MIFLSRSLFRAYLHTMYYLWTHVVTPKGMSISYSTYGIIASIGPFRTFGPTFSYFSSRIISHTTQKKNRMKWSKKYSTVSYRNILAVYCFVSKGIWFACFRERVLFIGTRFSNLMKRPPRGQTLEEDEIKELKLKFKKITFSIMKMIVLLFLNKILLEIRVAKYCFTALVNRTLLFLTAILAVYCFVPKGTNYSHVFPWWNRLLGKEKKITFEHFSE